MRQAPSSSRNFTVRRAALRCEAPLAKVEVCNITQLPVACGPSTRISSEQRKCTFKAKCAGSTLYVSNMAAMASRPW
ncbi:hypothetical protein D3C84_490310 [compost metagenome]